MKKLIVLHRNSSIQDKAVSYNLQEITFIPKSFSFLQVTLSETLLIVLLTIIKTVDLSLKLVGQSRRKLRDYSKYLLQIKIIELTLTS